MPGSFSLLHPMTLDIYWHDTMYVVSWYIVVAVGSLVLAVLIAVVSLMAWMLDGARRKT
jgi:hypothetical protein